MPRRGVIHLVALRRAGEVGRAVMAAKVLAQVAAAEDTIVDDDSGEKMDSSGWIARSGYWIVQRRWELQWRGIPVVRSPDLAAGVHGGNRRGGGELQGGDGAAGKNLRFRSVLDLVYYADGSVGDDGRRGLQRRCRHSTRLRDGDPGGSRGVSKGSGCRSVAEIWLKREY